MMPEEAAASFPLERAAVFLLGPDQHGFGQKLEASDFLPFIHFLIPYTPGRLLVASDLRLPFQWLQLQPSCPGLTLHPYLPATPLT